MRVAIDLTALLPERTGVDTYLLGLVRGLAEVDGDTRYTLFVNAEDAPALEGLPPTFTVRRASLRPRPVRLAFQQAFLPAFAAARGIDVVHSPAFITPLVHGRQRHLLTIHDLTFFSIPEAHTRLRRSGAYLALVGHSIRRADRISVPSAWVAAELRRQFPDVPADRTRVDPLGVAARFRPHPDPSETLRRLGVEPPYLLFVGTLQPRKNILGLLAGYRALVARRPDAPRLVLAGTPGWGGEELERALADPALAGRLVLPGYVADKDMPALYSGAELFVFPSLAEGFGFPPLEAMACGTPVVAGDATALRENLAGAAELVPPGDSDALAETFARLLADERERAALSARGLERARRFTWTELARRVAASYAELAATRS